MIAFIDVYCSQPYAGSLEELVPPIQTRPYAGPVTVHSPTIITQQPLQSIGQFSLHRWSNVEVEVEAFSGAGLLYP
jgi:hypothetical protein